jgi:Na+(H+)/acetate symporter ActP
VLVPGRHAAVTWTQVAQYIILIVAYMIPVVWLSVKQTGVPIPQAVYGYQLQKVTEREKQLLIDDPKEKEVIAIFKAVRRRPMPSSRTCPRRWRPTRPPPPRRWTT